MPLATNHLQNRLYPICRRRDRQPVSYTHLFRQNKALVERATRYITAAGSLLQAYTRVVEEDAPPTQTVPPDAPPPEPDAEALESAKPASGPVSYTHLDVYKRQALVVDAISHDIIVFSREVDR